MDAVMIKFIPIGALIERFPNLVQILTICELSLAIVENLETFSAVL